MIKKLIILYVFLVTGCTPVLHGIGVYEGSYPSGISHSHGYHPDGSIDIHIHTKNRPVILALSSYEPIIWNIIPDKGVVIKEIILSGIYASKVTGVSPSVIITRQQFGYTYQPNAKDSEFALKVIEYTGGIPFETFQGMYGGTEFSIH